MQTNSYVRGIGILVISLGSWFELLVMGVTPSWLLAEEACLALVVTGGILVLLSFYITENESAIWSVQSKIAKTIRMGVASFLFSFLFVFFLPLVPFKIAVPPCIVSGFGCPVMSGSYYTGYNSIGSEIFKWGGILAKPWSVLCATSNIVQHERAYRNGSIVLHRPARYLSRSLDYIS